jgi:hypothetical protein
VKRFFLTDMIRTRLIQIFYTVISTEPCEFSLLDFPVVATESQRRVTVERQNSAITTTTVTTIPTTPPMKLGPASAVDTSSSDSQELITTLFICLNILLLKGSSTDPPWHQQIPDFAGNKNKETVLFKIRISLKQLPSITSNFDMLNQTL